MEAVQVKYEKFKKDLDKNVYLCKLEETTKAPKEYVVMGSILFVCVLLVFRIGTGLICNLVGFVYPTYCSFKAVESDQKNDDTKWLIYWVFYAALTIVDPFLDLILRWIPFYYIFKVAFLIWCFHPSSEGANYIFNHFLKHLILTAEESVQSGKPSKADTDKQD
mmetsp:Transcript_18794/g.24803  ORF Transcript_18794/g.24803 Transcript_18794/m.24803 type:complete len:164 (+) Transcript_18794:157-648(+)|eukprot:CAMPEP_0117745904 /NCGR_PEP_ID=MMETSP0947-20121206/7641_1 /TAXON_ID=44440 /ORGANISM="Chattonella subsalsa, Strain CCMP2191" /LENGTH=163 /DNA_ID=CAMNT_0005563151 /DNA_START=146 /DNA_END=637 /DNA_ORIENTATION=+